MKWTICTLYVVQIVQSIIYPCPCTVYTYKCSLSMYNVHCTFYNVRCVKCKISTHYRLYTLQVPGTYMTKFTITQLLCGDSWFHPMPTAQGHHYLMLHIPPLYITSWFIGHSFVLNFWVVFLWRIFSLYISIL